MSLAGVSYRIEASCLPCPRISTGLWRSRAINSAFSSELQLGQSQAGAAAGKFPLTTNEKQIHRLSLPELHSIVCQAGELKRRFQRD
jgi:hypothetical protein